MKKIKCLAVVLIAAIMFAGSVSSYAMGFKAEEAYESIFVIESGNSLGSGFAIGENCIITNAHVIENKNDITIVRYSGESFSASVYSMDTEMDIAILYSSASEKLKPLIPCNSCNVGDDVYAIGAPNSMAYTLTKGIISSKDRVVKSQALIQTDAAINKGNSGGPLLNDEGKVIGVNTYKISDSEGIGLAIPIETIISYMKDHNLKVDASGNISGAINEDETETEKVTEDETKKAPDSKAEKKNRKEIVLLVLLGISVALNVVLITVLIYKKNKNQYVPVDPSERMDFDIDILE
ncbi:MAG: trypsin-like peptidase domain-containing protein [Clostridiales bacterium]|nr:trypsin-like peptidase domain-containing protein [Clostridiales bacterium]